MGSVTVADGGRKGDNVPTSVKQLSILSLIVTLIGLAFSSPAQAQSQPASSALACAEMSDSIHRLYLGFFLRDPEPEALLYWNEMYSSGEANLAAIADYMSQSEEFSLRYGQLDDEEFVTRMYINVLKRKPDAEGFNHWVQSLANGYPRGSVMAAFSESQEFVSRTNTVTPLAGYLRWYPEGTRWYCGQGKQTIDIMFDSEDVYTDYIFTNRSGQDTDLAAYISDERQNQRINVAQAKLGSNFALYRWDGTFTGNRDYTNTLQVEASPETEWIFVFYNESLGKTRSGWQVEETATVPSLSTAADS